MKIELYDWDALYERAMDKPFNSRELNAKDNARSYFEEIAKELRYNIDEIECFEDWIDDHLKGDSEEPFFDPNGNYVCDYDKGNAWRYE